MMLEALVTTAVPLACDKDQMMMLLQKALDKGGGTHTIADIVEALQAGKMQSIFNDSGLMITQVLNAPQRRVMEVLFCAGELPAILSLKPDPVAISRSNGMWFGRAQFDPDWCNHDRCGMEENPMT